MRSHALGVKGAAGVGPNRAPAGIWKPTTRPAPATVAVSRNSRRVTLVEARMLRLLRRAMDGGADSLVGAAAARSEEHTSELQSRLHLVCRLLLEKKKKHKVTKSSYYSDISWISSFV